MNELRRQSETSRAERFSPEIQGLRAVAVLAVLAYHIWPESLRGGFVGVDVFFVISGYLITGLLLREFEATGTISLRRFYARRMLRLLPAASVVVLAVLTCVSQLPQVRWHDVAADAMASTLYVQNWWLASTAVDYLASEHAASPLQHFWSLSVEEQYYFLWPLLLLTAGLAISRRAERARILFGVTIAAVFAASLLYSGWLTVEDAAVAYFATTTRAWELALGGLVAVWHGRNTVPKHLGSPLALLGLAMIGASALLIDASGGFPGFIALLPTCGAAMVICAGSHPDRRLPRMLLGSSPMRYIGDLSYSLYLWHWPAIVFFQNIAERQPDAIDGLMISGISIALAHLTKTLVEDEFRLEARWRIGSRPFVMAASVMAVCLLAALCVRNGYFPMTTTAAPVEVRDPAPAATPGSSVTAELRKDTLRPSLTNARKDNPDVYTEGCHASPRSVKPTTCSWGETDAKIHVVLVGDSHAAQWVPALQGVATANGWQLTSMTKSSCPFADVTVIEGKTRDAYRSCDAWNQAALRSILHMRPSLVVTSQAVLLRAHGTDSAAASFAAISAGLTKRWLALEQAGIRVVAIRDTPRMGVDVPDCLSSRRGSMERCGRPRHQVLQTPDPLVLASRDAPGITLLDFNDILCPGLTCPPVIGDILVWRDSHHMTATFARTLTPALSVRLVPMLDRRAASQEGESRRTDPQ